MAQCCVAESVTTADAGATAAAAAVGTRFRVVGNLHTSRTAACLANRGHAQGTVGRTVIAGAAGRTATMLTADFLHMNLLSFGVIAIRANISLKSLFLYCMTWFMALRVF